jgi:nitronate monooxygenase
VADAAKEDAWIARLAPHFTRFGARAPLTLREIYRSFVEDDDMLAMLVDMKPAVVSFHFGIPSADRVSALKAAGIRLIATATNLAEGRAAVDAGLDAVVAQGYEAGGHRGTFDPAVPDERLGTLALTRLLATSLSIPVIAAGGIMDGAGIAAVLALGAEAAQLGTAFLLCRESSADVGYRRAIAKKPSRQTVVTKAISGRDARCLSNLFTELGREVAPDQIPAYPITYDAGKALNAAAKAAGEYGYGAQWAGQGVALAREMPAGDLVETLWREYQNACQAGR